MNKNLRRLTITAAIIVAIYLVYDWQRKKTNLEREEITNGWYRYSNDEIEFDYPGKLRNCYECYPTSGSVYTVLTDENYVIMFMMNQNTDYLADEKRFFAYPEYKSEQVIRDRIDSILVRENLVPTDSLVFDLLKVNFIEFDPEEEVMTYGMEIKGRVLSVQLDGLRESRRGRRSYSYNGLDKEEGSVKRFFFDRSSGGLQLKNGQDDLVFEVIKIKRNRLLLPPGGSSMKLTDYHRFFKSVKLKD